jgi:lipid II:glycine glycyltransferase (peptidoglycan interpeptide bridge formation enzyme)
MITISNNPCLPQLIGNYFNYIYDQSGVWIGDVYVSIPYFSYGNSVFKEEKNKYQEWEYRGFEPISKYYSKDKISSILYLKKEIGIQFNHLESNVKRKINKAGKNNIQCKIGNSELIKDFYFVYCRNMLRLGSPPMEIGFFNEIITKYSNGNARIFVTYKGDKPIGSAILISYLGFYENCWFATLSEYNNLYTSYLLHWEMIKFSIENKAEIYSFGRSSQDSNVLKYKQQWKTEDITLYWSYSEDRKVNIRKLGFLSKIWKMLPLNIANMIGPYFAKKIY